MCICVFVFVRTCAYFILSLLAPRRSRSSLAGCHVAAVPACRGVRACLSASLFHRRKHRLWRQHATRDPTRDRRRRLFIKCPHFYHLSSAGNFSRKNFREVFSFTTRGRVRNWGYQSRGEEPIPPPPPPPSVFADPGGGGKGFKCLSDRKTGPKNVMTKQ